MTIQTLPAYSAPAKLNRFLPANCPAEAKKSYTFQPTLVETIWLSDLSSAQLSDIVCLIEGAFQPNLYGFSEWLTCLELGLL
jgi:hypothetical protein